MRRLSAVAGGLQFCSAPLLSSPSRTQQVGAGVGQVEEGDQRHVVVVVVDHPPIHLLCVRLKSLVQ